MGSEETDVRGDCTVIYEFLEKTYDYDYCPSNFL